LQRPADYDPYAAVTAHVSGVIVLAVDESELEEVEGEMSNGSTDLCDDVWCWPEGLAHYVEVHHVRLPDEFVAHAVSRHFEPAPRPSRGTELDYSFWLTWSQLNAPFRFEPHSTPVGSPESIGAVRGTACRGTMRDTRDEIGRSILHLDHQRSGRRLERCGDDRGRS